MRPLRYKQFLVVLVLSFGIFLAHGWARVTSRVSAARAKGRDAVKDGPRRGVSSQSKSRTAAKKATAVRAASSRTRRGSRRRARRYRQTWTTSSFADSTAGDRAAGEDSAVREAAVTALGRLNGSIVVVDANSGRLLTMVNQKVVLGDSYQPCSLIKLPVALAALHEGIVNKDTKVRLSRRWSLNLTEALARSNNPYFALLGREIGFEKMSEYAREFGLGEPAGINIAGEQAGTLPDSPPAKGGVGRMCSYGDEVAVTPLQVAALVSAIANGGRLYYLKYPQSQAELDAFQPQVKRQLDLERILPELREGMTAAVTHGTARRLDNPYAQVLGKTGTCSQDKTRLGWFASYETQGNRTLVVVVLLRGGRFTVGPLAAEVAGRIYRTLHERNYYAEQRRTPAP